MNKFRKLFFSLLIMFVCTIGLTYKVRAEEDVTETQKENYKIEVSVDKIGTVSADLRMIIDGLVDGDAVYYVKFVNNVTEKPDLSKIEEELQNVGRKIENYHSIANVTYNEKRVQEILIDDDWYMLDGYTTAYVVKKKYNSSEMKYEYNVSEPITVEKPKLPSLTQRYETYLFSNSADGSDDYLAVFNLFPFDGETGSHEINVKIGMINDSQLLKRISKNEAGSFESLMSYAKTNDGTVFTASKNESSYNIDIDEFKVVNGAYYYIYTYYKNTDGLYRNLDDITIAMGKHDYLVNEIKWNFEETEWEKFIKAFKNHDEVKAYTDEEISFYNDESKFIITLNEDNSTFKTEFNYKNGIVSYVFDESKTEEDKLMDTFFNSIALDVFAKKFGYKLEDLSTYMQKNPNLKVDENGIECEIGSLYIDEKTENSSLKINSEYFKKLSFNWLNGVKSFENSSNTVENPKTGINIQYGVLTLLAILTGAVYLLIRKYSKFPKHN